MAANRSSPAAAERRRRDISTGQSQGEEGLIRFVAGPDGQVAPDLGRKLPGRGVWVAADRAAIETAAKKGLFARAAKTKIAARPETAPTLADEVERLICARLLAGLGMARKAGDLVTGFEKVLAAVGAGRVAVLIEAADGAADGRRKLLAAARRQAKQPLLAGMFTAAELGLALGEENVIHSAFLAGRGADRWTADVRRLAGFRPLLPEGWREDSRDGATSLGRAAALAEDLERSGPALAGPPDEV
ncbi:MAG TPA: RNA-binding protein [Caulobacteraceae bacterium]|jgi:hypothetical protein